MTCELEADSYLIASPRTVWTEIDHEVVIWHQTRSHSHVLKSTGAVIYLAAAQGGTVADLVALVADVYEVEVSSVSPAINTYMAQLLDLDLISLERQ